MADGVAPEDVYDILKTSAGMDRAFAKLDTIKDHIIFWSNAAQSIEQLLSGEVAMTSAYIDRLPSAASELEKPLVFRLNGAAAGLGASIALLSDIIIADETAKIGDPHVSMGLVAGDGGAIIWPRPRLRAGQGTAADRGHDQRHRGGCDGPDQPCGAGRSARREGRRGGRQAG